MPSVKQVTLQLLNETTIPHHNSVYKLSTSKNLAMLQPLIIFHSYRTKHKTFVLQRNMNPLEISEIYQKLRCYTRLSALTFWNRQFPINIFKKIHKQQMRKMLTYSNSFFKMHKLPSNEPL